MISDPTRSLLLVFDMSERFSITRCVARLFQCLFEIRNQIVDGLNANRQPYPVSADRTVLSLDRISMFDQTLDTTQ